MEAADLAEQLGIPSEVASTLAGSLAAELATLDATGRPVTNPLGPSLGDQGTVDVSTAVMLPAKATRARRNPNVCLSFCHATCPGLERPPIVIVLGQAAVRDANLQANTDRYVRYLFRVAPNMFGRIPGPVLRRLAFYVARIYIEVTPRRILWWPEGDLRRPPETWVAPDDGAAPGSDPEPAPMPPASQPQRETAVARAPTDWQPHLAAALAELGPALLTTVDGEGYPVTVPALDARRVADGVALDVPPLAPTPAEGPACLSFHMFSFEGGIVRQENVSFAGTLRATDAGFVFRVERELAAISVHGMWGMARAFLGLWQRRGRLAREVARRGQTVPKVRLPTDAPPAVRDGSSGALHAG